MQTKHIPVQIVKSSNPKYDAQFIMSSAKIDRVSDTIDPAAYKPNLEKRLICLWQHRSDQPIGYWDNLRVKTGELIGDLKVSATNLGQMVKQLISDDVPLGASIGFVGKGQENDFGGIHFKELELLECSVVSVPCNQHCIQLAKQYGIEIQSSDQDPAAMSGDYQVAHKRAAQSIIAAKRVLKGLRT